MPRGGPQGGARALPPHLCLKRRLLLVQRIVAQDHLLVLGLHAGHVELLLGTLGVQTTELGSLQSTGGADGQGWKGGADGLCSTHLAWAACLMCHTS